MSRITATTTTTLTTATATSTSPVVVAVDAGGADLGASEVAAGCAEAAAKGISILFYGPAEGLPPLPDAVQVIDAPLSIAKSANPVQAVRANPQASIVQASRALAEGRAQALVSAGSTGTALACGLLHVRRLRGIHRPALALPLPVPGREGAPPVLLDVGANADARPEHLAQFAFIGAAFSSALLGVQSPRVGLLSNGTESERGNELVLSAAQMLKGQLADMSGQLPMQFFGNVESDVLFAGAAGEVDVVVTDGFTGNIALKLAEGVSAALMSAVREAAMSSLRGRAGGLLLRPALRFMRASIDPELQGGAYLLGLRNLMVIAHGRFSARGFARAIERAAAGARADIPARTHGALEQAGALRRTPGHPAPVRAGR